jgi:hypothetical protein
MSLPLEGSPAPGQLLTVTRVPLAGWPAGHRGACPGKALVGARPPAWTQCGRVNRASFPVAPARRARIVARTEVGVATSAETNNF